MKNTLFFVFFVSFNLQAFATPQAPDILIYKGDTTSLFAYPIEKYEKYDSLRLKLFGEQNGCGSMGCSRSYVAKWEIADNQLYLIGLYDTFYGFLIGAFRQLTSRICYFNPFYQFIGLFQQVVVCYPAGLDV